MTDAAQMDGKPGKKSSLRAVICVVGLALFAGVGWPGCSDLPPSPDAAGSSPTSGSSKPRGILHLDSFVVNLADSEGGRFLRVGIDLGLESPLPTTWGGEKGPGVPTARIRDSILAVLTTWRSDPLLAPDGKQKLKAELVRGLREHVPELGVREVYFTDFLVQR